MKYPKGLNSEANLTLSTTALPEGRAVRAAGLLRSALALTDGLLGQSKMGMKRTARLTLCFSKKWEHA